MVSLAKIPPKWPSGRSSFRKSCCHTSQPLWARAIAVKRAAPSKPIARWPRSAKALRSRPGPQPKSSSVKGGSPSIYRSKAAIFWLTSWPRVPSQKSSAPSLYWSSVRLVICFSSCGSSFIESGERHCLSIDTLRVPQNPQRTDGIKRDRDQMREHLLRGAPSVRFPRTLGGPPSLHNPADLFELESAYLL